MSAEDQGRELAARFRTEHNLGSQPLADLVAVIEAAQGVDVAVLDAGSDEHGMTAFDPERGLILMAVARTPHAMRQRSSLAHELAHVLCGDYQAAKASGQTWSNRSPTEIRADAFARHLLIPLAALSGLRGRELGESDLSELVQRFGTSPAIVAIQLHRIHLISARTKDAWRGLTAPVLAARHGWIDQYRALQAVSVARRAPQRLLTRATEGYAAGALSLQAIARLRGASDETVERDFAEAGIVQAEPEIEWSPADRLAGSPVDLSDLD